MKNIVLTLSPKTDVAELLAPDGEVEAFVNIPWLEEGEDSGSSKPGKEETVVTYSLSREAVGENIPPFPEGSELLCVHHPPSGASESKMVIIRRKDGVLASRPSDSSLAPDRIGTLPRVIGTVRYLLPWRDLVTVVGTSGVVWLLYVDATRTYRLLTSLPEAPVVEFAADDAHIEGYTPFAGADPEMDVEVDLHDVQELIDAEAISDWLEKGHALRIDKIIKRRVYESVGRRIGVYEDDVRQAGMVLTPAACHAAFGGALPSAATIVASSYTPPSARLLSWSLAAATLKLRIAFSLRPQRLSATFSLTSLQLAWRAVLGSLDLYVAETPRWWLPNPAERASYPVVDSLTSLRSEESSGFAFRFRCRSRASLIAEAQAKSSFRLSLGIDVDSVTEGVAILPLPAGDSPLVCPDYTDFEPLQPDGGMLTDEGVVLWRDRRLLTPMKRNGVVYRHRNLISDSPILAACRSLTRGKGDEELGRQTLTIFCRDGIRQVEADGKGGYRNVRFTAGITLDSSIASGYRINVTDRISNKGSATLFLSSHGIESLTAAGSHKQIIPFPAGVAGENVSGLMNDVASGALLIKMVDGTFRLWSSDDEEWFEISETKEVTTGKLMVFEGKILWIDEDGELVRVVVDRRETVISAVSERNVSRVLPGVLPPMTGKCGILTRALKLGSPFGRKRIWGISTAVVASFRIEGSDDLTDWHLLAEGISPRRGLHTSRFRYHRIRLIADASLAPHLSRLSLVISDTTS